MLLLAEQMRIGTISVREQLPPTGAAHITDRQIQDALWHYFYDVGKSVGYLVSTYVEKPKEKAKAKEAQKDATSRLNYFFTYELVAYPYI